MLVDELRVQVHVATFTAHLLPAAQEPLPQEPRSLGGLPGWRVPRLHVQLQPWNPQPLQAPRRDGPQGGARDASAAGRLRHPVTHRSPPMKTPPPTHLTY